MCAEATDNINNHTAVLPLTLTLSRREREPSGRRLRGQHIAGWRFAYPAYNPKSPLDQGPLKLPVLAASKSLRRSRQAGAARMNAG
ncbi:putative transcriptional regulator (LysR family) [Klebsiella variicola]|nr:putative transcriptional regulator (LysR family) [Klebsiella variicola]